MHPTLTHITATGIDRSTVPVALLALQRRYPLAEFGLLLSAKPQENLRFPDVEYLSRLEGLGLRLSLPTRERGLKQLILQIYDKGVESLPVRERELKRIQQRDRRAARCRSLHGSVN